MSQLRITWQDSAWIPHLNQANILDYFCQKSNPFYDKSCNNEIAKMQRLTPEQALQINGIEYILLHVQNPILYIIRKQHRTSTHVTRPITDYYIIAGVVHEAPDMSSIIQTRVLNAASHLSQAMDECTPQQFTKSQKTAERREEATKFQMRVGRLIHHFHNESIKK